MIQFFFEWGPIVRLSITEGEGNVSGYSFFFEWGPFNLHVRLSITERDSNVTSNQNGIDVYIVSRLTILQVKIIFEILSPKRIL